MCTKLDENVHTHSHVTPMIIANALLLRILNKKKVVGLMGWTVPKEKSMQITRHVK